MILRILIFVFILQLFYRIFLKKLVVNALMRYLGNKRGANRASSSEAAAPTSAASREKSDFEAEYRVLHGDSTKKKEDSR